MITSGNVLASDTNAEATSFPSLAAMRANHQALLRSATEMTSQRRKEILAFLDAGTKSGAVLQSRPDRSAAQALLDYWVGVLVNSPAPGEPSQFDCDDYLLQEFDPASAPDLSDKRCPYTGLAAFLESDADHFYGREEAIQALVNKLEDASLVLITGVSGSGKSSLVYAGLMPALKADVIAGSRGWNYLPVIIPGNAPIRTLLSAVCPASRNAAEWCSANAQSVLKSPATFADAARIAGGGLPSLLIVDQFEELFTLCEDRVEREAYATALVAFSQAVPGNRLIVTIREDFLREAAQLSALKTVAVDPEARYTPPAMSARDLRQVIEKPAAIVGLKFDEGIVDDLIKEVAGEPTALPLLQFTLLRLWEEKQRNRISWDAYRQVGNPREALKRTADAVYSRLPQDLDRQVARQIFQELVRPSVGYEFVRRRVRRESLRRLAANTTVDGVLQRFVAAGLIRFTPGIDADDDRFEVVHEALLRNWPLLAGWLEKKRQQSEVEIQLATTARLWKSSGRKAGFLLTGDAIDDALRHADASPEISELVEVSKKANSRHKRRVFYALTTACALLALLTTAAGIFAVTAHQQTQAAVREKEVADAATKEAKANFAKLEAQIKLTETAKAQTKQAESVAADNAQKVNNLAESLRVLATRPALLVCDGKIKDVIPPEWKELETKEVEISKILQSTGLVRLEGHPDLYAAGTAFVVAPDVVITTSQVASYFQNDSSSARPPSNADRRTTPSNSAYGTKRKSSDSKPDERIKFVSRAVKPNVANGAKRKGAETKDEGNSAQQGKVTASIDFGATFCGEDKKTFRIIETLLIDKDLSIALLKTEPLGTGHPPLPMPASAAGFELNGKPVYVVGYLFPDSRVPAEVTQGILRGLSGVKRLSPGKILGISREPTHAFEDSKMAMTRMMESVGTIMNDCTTLGGSGGAPLVDLESGAVLGVHSGGTFKTLKENHAIPNSQIISDSRVREILNIGKAPNARTKSN